MHAGEVESDAAQPKRAPRNRYTPGVHVEVLGDPKRELASPSGAAVHVVGPMQMCARLASQQHGVVSRAQLIAAGVSPMVIRHLADAGGLYRLHRGVYAVGHLALSPFAPEQAALLACGQPAFVSSCSALYVWGVIKARPPEVHITAVGHHCRKRCGIHLHLTPATDRRDLRTRHGLPVSSPARALVELAATAMAVELDDAVAEARALKLVRPGELESALARAGRSLGASRMRGFLREEDGSGITRSKAERRFRRYLREARLPQPKTNVPLHGVNADFLWPDEKVIVEVDSWQFHGHRRAFENDRRKDMILRDAGYVVIRVTWRQFTDELLALIAHIARALDRRTQAAA